MFYQLGYANGTPDGTVRRTCGSLAGSGGTDANVGIVQRWLTWPPCKGDVQIREALRTVIAVVYT